MNFDTPTFLDLCKTLGGEYITIDPKSELKVNFFDLIDEFGREIEKWEPKNNKEPLSYDELVKRGFSMNQITQIQLALKEGISIEDISVDMSVDDIRELRTKGV